MEMNQVGKLLVTGISGHRLTSEEEEWITHFGGVLLFSRNFESKEQLKDLTSSIKEKNSEIFIAVDHEGGRVQRFKNGFTHFQAMGEISKLNSPKLCFEVHQQMAQELSVCGVDVNFSPCSDLLIDKGCEVIGDRSFGDDPSLVSGMVSSAVRGLQTQGVFACAKHFPGHGNTNIDSHESLPTINDTIETILSRDLVPFKAATKSKVSMVMMAHLLIPSIDSENMTTVSQKAYELLRKELRFEGIIVTDDMEMGAIVNNFNPAEAAFRALKSGATLVEFRSFDKAREALEGLSKLDSIDQIIRDNLEIISKQKQKLFKNINKVSMPEVEVFQNGEKLKNKISLDLQSL